MLKELLRRVAAGGPLSLPELARAVGLNEELLKPMIEELARLGYLRPVALGCQRDCARCPLSAGRPAGWCSQLWALTAEGERAVRSG